MPTFADRVQCVTATTGTGAIAIGAPSPGYQSFADGGVADGSTVSYVLIDGADFEIGTGVFTAAGPSLSRDTVHRSMVGGTAGTALLNLSGGATVFVTARAADFGTAAQLDAGTGANELVQLDGSARLPAVDGSQLTGVSAGTGWVYSVETSSVTAAHNNFILTDTTAGPFTVTLPATPSLGDRVGVQDISTTWGTNALTIARNGSTIDGTAEDLVCDVDGIKLELVYTGTTWTIAAETGGYNNTALATVAQTGEYSDLLNPPTGLVTLTGAQTLTNKTLDLSANTVTVDGTEAVGFRGLPRVDFATGTLIAAHNGKMVRCSGNIIVPNGVFASGNALSIYNQSTFDVTITLSITNAYISGGTTDYSAVTLNGKGMMSIWFDSGTECVMTGAIS